VFFNSSKRRLSWRDFVEFVKVLVGWELVLISDINQEDRVECAEVLDMISGGAKKCAEVAPI